MDILTFASVQGLLKGDRPNQYFERDPIFAFYASQGASYAVIDFYGERDNTPMQTFTKGQPFGQFNQPPAYNIWPNHEMSNAGFYWGFHASAEVNSSGYSPTNGYVGLGGQNQLMCMHGADFNRETVLQSQWSTMPSTLAGTGIVLGEDPSYVQGINLIKYGGDIFLDWANNRTIVAQNKAKFAWTALAGLTRLAGAASAGHGDICYNRKLDQVAFLETNTSSGVSRIHIFKKLSAKLKADPLHLKTMLEDAIAGRNGSSYEVFDFNWSANNDQEWSHGTNLIPCDDGTFWLTRMYISSYLALARISFTTNNGVPTTTRTFSGTIDTVAITTTYGRASSDYYGQRHMNSDDEKFIACYCQYYYYCAGGAFFFLPRDSAQTATRFKKFQYTSSTHGMTIAPIGGSDFVLGRCTNQDSKYQEGTTIDLSRLILDAGTIPTGNWQDIMFSGYGQSTSYGGNGFVKVQPTRAMTTEWQERA